MKYQTLSNRMVVFFRILAWRPRGTPCISKTSVAHPGRISGRVLYLGVNSFPSFSSFLAEEEVMDDHMHHTWLGFLFYGCYQLCSEPVDSHTP